MTLFELLSKAQEFDNATEELDFDQVITTWDEIKTKVDDIYELLSKWEYEEKRHKDLAKEHAQAAKTLANKQASLKGYVESAMILNQADKLPGLKYQFKMSKLTSFKYPPEASFESLECYGNKYVKAEYTWRKQALKDDFKVGKLPENMDGIVQTFVKPSLRTGIKK